MKPMIDFSKGWAGIEEYAGPLISRPAASMDIFPLCCSTGVLKAVSAARPADNELKAVLTGKSTYINVLPDREKIETAATIRDLIRLVAGNPYFVFPEEVMIWYCMSLVHLKGSVGTDEQGHPGYHGYKASSIVMFDRLLEDKDPSKGFRFQYNMVFSVDHFQQWLSQQEGQYGEVLLSAAEPGAHGARVRGCIFTPDKKALEKYEKEHIEQLRVHMLSNWDALKIHQVEQKTDAVAKYW